MDKLSVSLEPIIKEIRKAEKELRVIRRRLSKANKRKIDFEIRDLEKAKKIILTHCFMRTFPAVEK